MNKLGWLLVLATCFRPAMASAAEQNVEVPNFIIIFCDDMGYADIGPFGAEGYKTPHLDRMARQGMKFTNFYVGRSY